MKSILTQLYAGKTLSRETAKSVMEEIGAGNFNSESIAAFLSIYNLRAVTLPEMLGFREAMLKMCLPVHFSDTSYIDMCGTGGDGKDTFNISTLSAMVCAGAGVKVAKHGNYAVSSSCGSSNVLEYLGVKFTNDNQKLQQQLSTAGICILHAPLFHPAMKHVAPIRKAMQVKTLFNIMGPLSNPAQPTMQVTGVYHLEVMRLYANIMQQTHEDFSIIHSLDGYDEISLTGQTKMQGKFKEFCLSAEEMGFHRLKQDEIKGGVSIAENADIFMNILEGKGSEAQNNAVIANAACGIMLAKKISWMDAVTTARKSLMDGNALLVLNTLRSFN